MQELIRILDPPQLLITCCRFDQPPPSQRAALRARQPVLKGHVNLPFGGKLHSIALKAPLEMPGGKMSDETGSRGTLNEPRAQSSLVSTGKNTPPALILKVIFSTAVGWL